MKRSNDSLKKRMDELEFILHKSQQRSSQLDEINKKIFEGENNLKIMEAKFNTEISNLHNGINVMKEKNNVIHQESQAFKRAADDLKCEINSFFDEICKFKEQFTGDLVKTQEELNRNLMDLHHSMRKCEDLVKGNTSRLDKHGEEFKRQDLILETYKRNLTELYKKAEDLIDHKIDKQAFENEMNVIRKDVGHIKYSVDDAC